MNSDPAVAPDADGESVSSVPGVPGLIPYENFTGVSMRTAPTSADLQLEEGWEYKPKFPRLMLDQPMPWDDATPAYRSWNFTIHSLYMLQVLLLAHSRSGLPKYLRAAARIVLDWVTRHAVRDDETQSKFAWYDMAVGLRAQRIAYVLDAGIRAGLLDDAQIAAIRASLDMHREYLADDANIVFHNNHGFYQVAGQLAMGRRFGADDPAMAEATRQGNQRFLRMLAVQFTDEGVHKEHSPDYHRMVYDSLRGILDSGLVEMPEVLALAQRIEDALAWFILPTAEVVNFGDSDARSVRRNEADANTKWTFDAMRFMSSGGAVGRPPEATVRAFEHSGYFVARDRWPTGPEDFAGGSYLAQTAAFHSRTHKHADDLSFVWYDRGQELLVDAGRYGYLGKAEMGSALWEDGYWYADPWRVYVESTAAHNTVEIDGRNYRRKGVKPYGSAIGRWGREGELAYCETEIRHFRTIRHARVLVINPGEWLLVFDWLQDNADEPHDFRQWFHFGPALTVLPSGLGFVAHVPGAEKLLRVASLLPTPLPGRLELGTESPTIQGFYSPREKTLIPNYALAYEALATPQAGFATLFTFSGETQVAETGNTMARSGRTATFRWTSDGVATSLHIDRPAEGPLVIRHKTGAAR